MEKRKLSAGIWVATLLFVSGFDGCRFGNHVVKGDTSATTEGYDGYYAAAPQTLVFCADHTSTNCAQATVNQLPETLSAVFTNPVILVQDADNADASWFVSNDANQYSLPTAASLDGTISYSGSTDPATAWDDPACTSVLYIDEQGSWNATDVGTTATSGETLSGHISLTISVIRSFEGDCAGSLTAIQACYNDASTCGGSTEDENIGYQQSVRALFSAYVEAGTMTADDIPSLHSIAYEATFE